MKCLIVGGVAGGATVAARLRRDDEKAEIILLERGDYISYANCGLPYYLGGTIKDRDRLFVQTPKGFSTNFRVDVRTRNEAVAIDRNSHELIIKNLRDGTEYREGYDKLVLSPGAEPIRPAIPGIDLTGIFTLRDVAGTDAIQNFISTENPRRALIVGAGFIGLEMAENLHRRGIFVTIVEATNQVMNILDYEMAAAVHQHLKVKGVEFYLQDAVSSFSRSEGRLTAALSSGRRLTADLVILSIGVRPDNRLAATAGLSVGKTGGIHVDANLRTDDPDIYALGDAIEFRSPILGKPALTPLAGPANKQGRIVADNIAFGDKRTYRGSIGTGIAKVFDLTVASTGASEKLLEREGMPFLSAITHSSSHAGYYPNAIPLSIKILFSPSDGRLLGAQIVGYEGVDKRIDLFASVLGRGGTIQDLQEIEHAYAPPYSSAKDPVNIAGFVAENILTGRSATLSWKELLQREQHEAYLLDVRTPEEYAIETIEGAVNIPLAELRERLSELPHDKEIVVFCGVGQRAYNAERILRQSGFEKVHNLSGGTKTYLLATQKQSNEDIYERDFVGKDDMIYQVDPFAPKPADHPGSGTTGDAGSAGNGRGAATGGAERPFGVRTLSVDACGLQCPGPIMRLAQEIKKLGSGERIIETATDPGFSRDVESWARMTGNRLLELKEDAGRITAVIEKAEPKSEATVVHHNGNAATIVVFSDSLDKALASFVIANGAASAGKSVTMFFTFWGLSVLKKPQKPRVRKDFMGRMFGMMLPGSSQALKLSRLNMAGFGSVLMRSRMKAKRIDSLESMIQAAMQAGIRLVGCQMSMDLMGVAREELYEGVEIGGVATYLEAAGGAQANLFI